MNKKTHEIVPHKSVGCIYFSDDRELVREKIGGEYAYGRYEFNDVVELYDFFPEQDIKVLYDKNERLGSIEFFKGGVFFLGKDIMTVPYLVTKEAMMSLDSDIDISQEGFTSYKLGIGIAWDEEYNRITSVIVFKKDYYS